MVVVTLVVVGGEPSPYTRMTAVSTDEPSTVVPATTSLASDCRATATTLTSLLEPTSMNVPPPAPNSTSGVPSSRKRMTANPLRTLFELNPTATSLPSG